MDKTLEPWVKFKSGVLLEHHQRSVHSSGCTRREKMFSDWNTTQNEGMHVHFESTRKFLHSTERRPKSNNVTRGKQRHTQS